MADKEVLERILSMLPEEFQDIYDDTIPEAKEIRKKMGKKASSVKSYSCAMPRFEDIRKLNYKGQAKVCKTFHQYLKKNPNVVSFFLDRFEETYSRINMKDLEESKSFSIACFVSFSERLACSVGIFQSIPRLSSRIEIPPSASG